jgi:hypothetical protein
MEQYKLKKVMKMTHLWIQDNKYSNHAKVMKHIQWKHVLPIRPMDIWTLERAFFLDHNENLQGIGKWNLRKVSKEGRMFQGDSSTSYMMTPMGTFSTQDELESENEDR